MLEHAPQRVKELHTRFLYSFFFDGRNLPTVSAKLQRTNAEGFISASAAHNSAVQQTLNADGAKPASIWRCAPPHAFYEDEVLKHVNDFLFAADSKNCEYLKVAPEVLNLVFQHHRLNFHLSRQLMMPVKLIPKIGIELFLTAHGVGVLSIGLMPAQENLTFDEAIDFNYRLARFDPMPPAALRIPHPRDDAARFERIPETERAQIALPPALDAPLSERLGRAGGAFTLPEVIASLLAPLDEFDLERTQNGLSVCTVARLDADVDFNKAASRAEFARLISALAQIEESNHAGTNSVSIANEILNRKHWAAAGLLGAAHLVADQAASEALIDADEVAAHPFNVQRVPRVRDKYFIPYLMALMQRLFLDRTIRRATLLIGETFSEKQRAENEKERRADSHPQNREKAHIPKNESEKQAELGRLRNAILQFAIAGHFVQVSSRESLHRFYRIAQQGLDVPEAWAEVRFAVSDLDRKFAVEREMRVSQTMAENLTAINHVQKVIHLIEYVVVGTYAAEFWHLLVGERENREEIARLWDAIFGEHLGGVKHAFENWFSVPLSTVIAFAIGILIVKMFNLYVEREER
jgi:hypothetical protein